FSLHPSPSSPLFPYTTLFRSVGAGTVVSSSLTEHLISCAPAGGQFATSRSGPRPVVRRSFLPRAESTAPWLHGWGAFGVGQVAVDEFPVLIWASLVARRCRSMAVKSFHYGDQMDFKSLLDTL